MTRHLYSTEATTTSLRACGAALYGGPRPSDYIVSGIRAVGPCLGDAACFVFVVGPSEGYGHDRPGVCLGDGQTESYLKNTGITGLASAWAMARRRPKEYRRKVDAATSYSGVCPHT